jgi:hypothetical protein
MSGQEAYNSTDVFPDELKELLPDDIVNLLEHKPRQVAGFYRHLGLVGFNIVLMKRFQPLYFHPNF